MSDSYAIFGAGPQGRTAAALYMARGEKIRYFIDNDKKKQGTQIWNIPVVDIKEFAAAEAKKTVVIAVPVSAQDAVRKQLLGEGITDFIVFDKEILLRNERFISYSYATENEDVILYHVLKNEEKIFWIDVGSNDPTIGSVTKAFYDRGHCGVNIDIEEGLIEISRKERPRDVNIHAGIGKTKGAMEYYAQGDWGGLSTMVAENARKELGDGQRRIVNVVTLKDICDEHVKDQTISFLKIDVEGMERDVIEGADFERYRPKILVIESTLPRTDMPNYAEWEALVIDTGYHFAYAHGVNRYYVADEHVELDDRFIPWQEMAANYCVFQVNLLYCI